MIGTKGATLQLSRFYSLPSLVTWRFRGGPRRGGGRGVPPTPPGSRETPVTVTWDVFSSIKESPLLALSLRQTLHSTMPSEEEQQPGPSGISREEVLTLLGLNTSDSEDSDDDDDEEDQWCNQALDDFERQRAFQTQLLQQSGGGLDPKTPVGTFEFDLDPYVNRTGARMGELHRHPPRSPSPPRCSTTHHDSCAERNPQPAR